MDWLTRLQQQAQDAADKLISSEAAEKARRLATEATKQATIIAHQATIKAQEVAKEAMGEAEKSITAFRHKAAQEVPLDPQQLGITPELERFVCSLTYSTFSDYPLDSLDVPTEAAAQRLNKWQENHARLMLQRVQQLQDLRFVLCPKRMDEYTFWLIYFTLCKRYLPDQQEQQPTEDEEDQATAAVAAAGAAAAAAAAAAGVSSAANSTGGAAVQPAQSTSPDEHSGAHPTGVPGDSEAGGAAPPSGGEPAAAAAASSAEDPGDLAELADDPELTAYLQDALQLDSKAADGDSGELLGSDVEDLDDYLTQLDAEVNAQQ